MTQSEATNDGATADLKGFLASFILISV